ncbi:MAG: hypothetical protein V3T77_02430 [Planctomycetota bacterium]
MARKLEYNAILAKREDLTPSLAIFRVQPDSGVPAGGNWFVPGQYIAIGLNSDEKPATGSVQRPMSIASAPEDPDFVDFYIRYVNHPTSENPLTHLLWKNPAGTRLFMRMNPKGRFTLAATVGEGDSRLKVFVSAGTGLAPFRSMVRSYHNQHPQARLDGFAILHGASYPQDLGYRDELQALAESHGLCYLSTISRPNEAPEWQGGTGRVEDLFLPEQMEATERALGLGAGGLCAQNAVVYVCGLQGTIGKTFERLVSRGFVPHENRIRRSLGISKEVPSTLFWEQYDTEPVIDLKDEAVVAKVKGDLNAALDRQGS